jgi:hypothetical protein
LEAEATFQEAVEGGVETLGLDHSETLSSMYRLGVSQCKLNFFAKAKDKLHQALKGQLKALRPSDVNTLDSLLWLGCPVHHV